MEHVSIARQTRPPLLIRPDWRRLAISPIALVLLATLLILSFNPLDSRFLTLTPEVRALPLYQEGRSDRVLLIGPANGREAFQKAGFGHWTVQRSHSFAAREPKLIELLRAHRLFLNTRFVPALCLLGRLASADTTRP